MIVQTIHILGILVMIVQTIHILRFLTCLLRVVQVSSEHISIDELLFFNGSWFIRFVDIGG